MPIRPWLGHKRTFKWQLFYGWDINIRLKLKSSPALVLINVYAVKYEFMFSKIKLKTLLFARHVVTLKRFVLLSSLK